MTLSILNKRQRKKIRRIARDWQKGKIKTPEQLYEQVKEQLADAWSNSEDEVKAELDRALSSPSWQDHAKRAGALLMRGLTLVVFLYVVAESITIPLLLHDSLSSELAEILGSSGTASVLPTSTSQLATSTPTLPPTPSLIPTTEPTPTPSLILTTEPTPTALPPLVISGVVTTSDRERVNLSGTQLTLSSKGEGEQGWVDQETIPPDSDSGTFRLESPAGQEPRYYRLEIGVSPGVYVDRINPIPGWRVLTDTISGFEAGLESLETLGPMDIPNIEVVLAAVPDMPFPLIQGQFKRGNIRRSAPFFAGPYDQLKHVGGEVGAAVEVYGQYRENARLACCEDNDGEKWYFWAGNLDSGWLIEVDQEQESRLPAIYLPSGFDPNEPFAGWEPETVDGLMILSSQVTTGTPPATLEWRIDNVQGWLRLDVWAPRGSQAATYQIVAVVDGEEVPLTPLDGSLQVTSVANSALSTFQSIGTYHLNREHAIVIRLQPREEEVKAGLIRLLK